MKTMLYKHSQCAKEHPKKICFLPFGKEKEIADLFSCSVLSVLQKSCSLEIMPERFLRNAITYSPKEQGRLLSSSLLLVGMGGLGGILFDTFLRIGIGKIYCSDGDTFEASNLNRQLLSTEEDIGCPKTSIGKAYSKKINSSSTVYTIDTFLDRTNISEHIKKVDIVVDALGGLTNKPLLREKAEQYNITLITGGIAGKSGYVGRVHPGSTAPTDWLGNVSTVENLLGNLPQTILFASSLMVELTVETLIKKYIKESKAFLFDLENTLFQKVQW
ncbi:MAG: ThiF family adenylyltransferase [Desulfovibrionaceae bacterium]